MSTGTVCNVCGNLIKPPFKRSGGDGIMSPVHVTRLDDKNSADLCSAACLIEWFGIGNHWPRIEFKKQQVS